MQNEPTISPGTEISGYRITELIGKGGFSQVWSAWDTRLNRLIAIKIIPRADADAHGTIQFGREAAVVTRLEHPHILPLYDYGETPQYRYLVMRYATGGSLAQRVERGRIPIPEILRLMTYVAATLDYIHEKKVVHRDLKPGNILLDAQGLPYLTDFGLAKELTAETVPMHSSSGTLTYMPPEQFSGGAMSVRSDQYSFGILLYQLFTGQLPHDGKVALGMRQLSTSEKLPSVNLVDPTLPEKLDEFLQQLTDPDPMKRPENVTAIIQEIAALLNPTQAADQKGAPISLALESSAYRQHEAESLLRDDLVTWRNGLFTLSLTHFVLLDMLLSDLPALLNPEVRSLMLRGVLEYDQRAERWWDQSTSDERKRACRHAILNGTDGVRLRALRLAVAAPWVAELGAETINHVGKHLVPMSDQTPIALQYLERALPAYVKGKQWTANDPFGDVDNNLRTLAIGNSPIAERAAALIGSARRTSAMIGLPRTIGQLNPTLIAYETAGNLPDKIPAEEQVKLALALAARQLTRNRPEAVRQYLWAAAANSLAFGSLVFITLRGTDILGQFRLLNTLGLGLLLGLVFGSGVWLARHIAQRLMVAPFWLRVALGTIAGGLIVAAAFSLYHAIVLSDDGIDSAVSISSGMIYVVGFALSVGLTLPAQIVLGSAGVIAALIIPWPNYVLNDITPPIILADLFITPDLPSSMPSALALATFYALLLAVVALGYRWRSRLRPSTST
jgi:serine/threonine protein kinase